MKTPNKIMLLLSIIMLSIACKKEENKIQAFPFEGEWKVKSVGSGKYLKYYDILPATGFDIFSGIASTMKFIPGKSNGSYFICASANPDKFMDLNNMNYTYLTSHNFMNSTSQNFTVEPIYKNADRYYIRSVADTSMYLVSDYDNIGRATTTALRKLDLNGWDCIWILEKP